MPAEPPVIRMVRPVSFIELLFVNDLGCSAPTRSTIDRLISTHVAEREARGTGRIGMAVRRDDRDGSGEPRRPPPRASSSDALVAPARAGSPRGAALPRP